MSSTKRIGALALAVAVLVGGFTLLTGRISFGDQDNGPHRNSAQDLPGPRGTSTVGGTPEVSADTALLNLEQIEVAPEGSMEGYSREDFEHWVNAEERGWAEPSYVADPDSCNVRQATLIDAAWQVTLGEDCEILSGMWTEPYAAQTLSDPSDLAVDHVVPLAEAYRSGASEWSEEEKADYANNNLTVLAVVDDGADRAKGDKGFKDWLPPNEASHCSYTKRYVWIKRGWFLTVTPEEKRALEKMLAECGV